MPHLANLTHGAHVSVARAEVLTMPGTASGPLVCARRQAAALMSGPSFSLRPITRGRCAIPTFPAVVLTQGASPLSSVQFLGNFLPKPLQASLHWIPSLFQGQSGQRSKVTAQQRAQGQ